MMGFYDLSVPTEQACPECGTTADEMAAPRKLAQAEEELQRLRAGFDPGPAPNLDRDGYDEAFVERAAEYVARGIGEGGHLPTIVAELYAMYRRRVAEIERMRPVFDLAVAYVNAPYGEQRDTDGSPMDQPADQDPAVLFARLEEAARALAGAS